MPSFAVRIAGCVRGFPWWGGISKSIAMHLIIVQIQWLEPVERDNLVGKSVAVMQHSRALTIMEKLSVVVKEHFLRLETSSLATPPDCPYFVDHGDVIDASYLHNGLFHTPTEFHPFCQNPDSEVVVVANRV